MIDEEESYSIMDIKEADPKLEKHRKEVIEKYIEYEIALLQDFKEQDKSINDYIDHMKTTLWYIKEQRAQQIKNELGI
jgi:transposase